MEAVLLLSIAVFCTVAFYATKAALRQPVRYVDPEAVTVIRPRPEHVRPVGAPERVCFPRRTPTGRGTL